MLGRGGGRTVSQTSRSQTSPKYILFAYIYVFMILYSGEHGCELVERGEYITE